MKRCIYAVVAPLLLMTLSGFVNHQSREGKHLFILSGQSNMARLNPAGSFIPTVETEFGKDHVIVVKDAQGGQPIRRWYKKWKPEAGDNPEEIGDLYDRLMEKVRTAVAGEKLQTVTFIWMQGERDAREGYGKVYEESLRGLYKQLSRDLNRRDIQFVIGRISDFGFDKKEFPHWSLVREAQVRVAGAGHHAAWVDTDDLNGEENGLHYSPEGYKILGKRFADQTIGMIQRDNPGNMSSGIKKKSKNK